MKPNTIAFDLEKKNLAPIYWIDGSEDFFINETVHWVENSLLTDAQKSFDFSVFYGKDASFEQVFNACRKPPMFFDYSVVLLKEAQQFKDIKKLENYLLKPLKQTILIIVYKEKVFDFKTKFGLLLKEKTKRIHFDKLKELELESWIQNFVNEHHFLIQQKAVALLIQQLGNDVTKIVNELQKLFLVQKKEEAITFERIAEYVGLNKEHNVFELQNAFAKKDKKKMMEIMEYLIHHEKNNPFLQINIILYRFFYKVLIVLENKHLSDKEIASKIGINPFFIKDFMEASKVYSKTEVEKNILVLSEYNLKALGVKVSSIMSDAALKKEMLMKLILN